jgi:hypothetical protein
VNEELFSHLAVVRALSSPATSQRVSSTTFVTAANSLMVSYPFTAIFTWSPSGSPFNSLQETCNSIKSLSSCAELKWEVIATVKTCNSTVHVPAAEKKKGKEQKSSVVFIEYDDCNGMCVIHSKPSSQYCSDDVLIADENIENLLTPFAGLSHRSTRKIQGFRYHLGDHIASVGIVDHGPLAGQVVLELAYLGLETDLAETMSQLCALANSFVSSSDRSSAHLHFKYFFRPFEAKQSKQFLFSDRALLWIDSLQLLQP